MYPSYEVRADSLFTPLYFSDTDTPEACGRDGNRGDGGEEDGNGDGNGEEEGEGEGEGDITVSVETGIPQIRISRFKR